MNRFNFEQDPFELPKERKSQTHKVPSETVSVPNTSTFIAEFFIVILHLLPVDCNAMGFIHYETFLYNVGYHQGKL